MLPPSLFSLLLLVPSEKPICFPHPYLCNLSLLPSQAPQNKNLPISLLKMAAPKAPPLPTCSYPTETLLQTLTFWIFLQVSTFHWLIQNTTWFIEGQLRSDTWFLEIVTPIKIELQKVSPKWGFTQLFSIFFILKKRKHDVFR